jgi:FG-GAP-like repeat/FG-GAP repeat
MKFRWLITLFSLLLPLLPFAKENEWHNLSSRRGELPAPGESNQQTGSLIADLDRDRVNDFVLSFRKTGHALVWYRRTKQGWDRYLIEKEFLTVEAGGASCDLDRDGDLDLVFGCDSKCDQVWWWENPYPTFDPAVSWRRRLIKSGGMKQHHDQIFADLKGTSRPQLVFWNQGAKTIFIAEIPADPRNTEPWPFTPLYSGAAGAEGRTGGFDYPEGLAAADIDADGKPDLLAGNYWFKREGDKFTPIKIGEIGGRVAAGKFKRGKYPQIVIAPGDGNGPVKWYECRGNPLDSADWVGHDLVGRPIIHGHTLAVADIDGDGHQDIFTAEMAKWNNKPEPDNPAATAWIFYGDGKGDFRKTELVVGHGFHEGRVADLDGDGDLDILNKPYTWDAPRVDVWLQNGTGTGK